MICKLSTRWQETMCLTNSSSSSFHQIILHYSSSKHTRLSNKFSSSRYSLLLHLNKLSCKCQSSLTSILLQCNNSSQLLRLSNLPNHNQLNNSNSHLSTNLTRLRRTTQAKLARQVSLRATVPTSELLLFFYLNSHLNYYYS